MENRNNYVEDMISRYIYQVIRRLPINNRKDIEQELKTLIYDMLEERTNGNTPEKKDIDVILTELGSPYELAEKYRDKTHYLIGPVIFPAYVMLLKIVLGATLLGMTVASLLGLITTPSAIWYDYIGSWIGNISGGLFMAFAWVTILFAIFEWRGVNLKEMIPEWELSSLPTLPSREISIPIWGPIAGIIFTVLAMIIFTKAPQLIGVYYFSDTSRVIPVFDLEVLRTVLPLFLIGFGLGILRNIWEIVERKITMKYAIFTVIIDLIKVSLLIIIFTRFPIWNQNFIEEINALFHFNMDAEIPGLWEQFTSKLVIFLIVVYLIECFSTVYKAIKYSRE